ncbi:MAG: FGGY-family carbohydrate kinase [Sedimenticola sp.]
MIKQAFIGIDLGTSGCRVIAIDADETPLLELKSDLPPSHSAAEGQSVQSPEAWWEAVLKLLQQTANQLTHHEPAAIAVDGTSSTVLLTDGQGTPLTPALMYDDTSAREYTDRIASIANPLSSVHSANSSLAKLLLLADSTESDRVSHVLHQADWISGRLCGDYGFSDPNNCLKLGYDPVERRWPDWMERFGFPLEWLPEVFPAGTTLGRLDHALARKLGFPAETRVVAGTTDSTAAVLASGISRPGQAVTSLGSTMVLKILSDKPVSAPRYGIYSQPLGDRWLAGGASNSGGTVLRKFFSDDRIEQLTRQLDPDRESGLDYYPLPAPGERFPVNDPDMQPRLEPRPGDDALFFQGLLEGMSGIEHQGYRLLETLGTPPLAEVFSIGGGALNEPWRVIRERRLGVPVHTCKHQQAAFGVALLARNSH